MSGAEQSTEKGAHPRFSDLRSWQSRAQVMSDCMTCGAVGPEGISKKDREAARRWARRHALNNPGHLAAAETVSARCYQIEDA